MISKQIRSGGAVGNPQLLREGEPVFFRSVVSGKWVMLHWMAPYPRVCSHNKLEPKSLKKKKKEGYVGWVGKRRARSGRSWELT